MGIFESSNWKFEKLKLFLHFTISNFEKVEEFSNTEQFDLANCSGLTFTISYSMLMPKSSASC